MAIKSSFKNMVVVLAAVCLVSSALVGGLYALTKDSIDKVNAAIKSNAISKVVPAFDNVPNDEAFESLGCKVYPAKMGGSAVGYAIESVATGFGGPVKIMVGFLPDGTIQDISVLSHSETPGLGAKIDNGEGAFRVQFQGKNPADFKLAVTKEGGNVDAITASTITSKAFCKAVTLAYDAFKNIAPEEKEVPFNLVATPAQESAEAAAESSAAPAAEPAPATEPVK